MRLFGRQAVERPSGRALPLACRRVRGFQSGCLSRSISAPGMASEQLRYAVNRAAQQHAGKGGCKRRKRAANFSSRLSDTCAHVRPRAAEPFGVLFTDWPFLRGLFYRFQQGISTWKHFVTAISITGRGTGSLYPPKTGERKVGRPREVRVRFVPHAATLWARLLAVAGAIGLEQVVRGTARGARFPTSALEAAARTSDGGKAGGAVENTMRGVEKRTPQLIRSARGR